MTYFLIDLHTHPVALESVRQKEQEYFNLLFSSSVFHKYGELAKDIYGKTPEMETWYSLRRPDKSGIPDLLMEQILAIDPDTKLDWNVYSGTLRVEHEDPKVLMLIKLKIS